MPTIGPLELFLIVLILVLVFGVGKLGDIGKAMGRGIREFRQEVGPSSGNKNELPDNSGVTKVDVVEERDQQRTS